MASQETRSSKQPVDRRRRWTPLLQMIRSQAQPARAPRRQQVRSQQQARSPARSPLPAPSARLLAQGQTPRERARTRPPVLAWSRPQAPVPEQVSRQLRRPELTRRQARVSVLPPPAPVRAQQQALARSPPRVHSPAREQPRVRAQLPWREQLPEPAQVRSPVKDPRPEPVPMQASARTRAPRVPQASVRDRSTVRDRQRGFPQPELRSPLAQAQAAFPPALRGRPAPRAGSRSENPQPPAVHPKSSPEFPAARVAGWSARQSAAASLPPARGSGPRRSARRSADRCRRRASACPWSVATHENTELSTVPQTMLSPSLAVPQTMLSPRRRCPRRCCRRRRPCPTRCCRRPCGAPHDVVAAAVGAPDDVVAVAGGAPHDVVAGIAVPQTMSSQSAPPQSVPQTMLSPPPPCPTRCCRRRRPCPRRCCRRRRRCPTRCCRRDRGAPDDVVAASRCPRRCCVPQTMLSPFAVPHTMLSPRSPRCPRRCCRRLLVLATPQVVPSAHALRGRQDHAARQQVVAPDDVLAPHALHRVRVAGLRGRSRTARGARRRAR